MAYCTVEAVLEQLCGVETDPLGDAEARAAALAGAIAQAGADVDRRCRRTFEPPAGPEERRFDGSGGRLMRVADMVRFESVRVDGAEARPAYAYPSDGPPYRWIATGDRFPRGERNVAVVAWWGFAESVPVDIARATAALAAAEVLGRLQPARSGGVRMQAAGQAREEFPEGGPYADRIAALERLADRLLLPYRRWIV